VDVYNLAAQKEKLLSALMRAPTELTLAIPKLESEEERRAIHPG
jgi:hypothetical protein